MENRSFGLDFLRSICIWMVMLSHVAYWFAPLKDSIYINVIMPLLLGVEPFFVLGGFLAAISFHHVIRKNNNRVNLSDASSYVKRRWLRTLPNYFLFLAIYAAAFSVTKEDFSFDVNYLFFTQNLFWLAPNFFSVSWSLATQEWFYVLLPASMLIFSKANLGQRINLLVTASCGLIIVSFVARLIYLNENPVDNLEGPLRRILLLRLDSVAIGVLIGHIYFSNKEFFYRYRLHLFCLGITCIVALCYLRRVPSFSEQYIIQMIFYPTFSFSLAICMPWIYEISRPQSDYRAILFEQTSKWSYSLYLSHVFFLDAIYLVGRKIGISFNGDMLTVILTVLWIGVTYTVSALLYNYFEKPMLKLGHVGKSGFFGNLPKNLTMKK